MDLQLRGKTAFVSGSTQGIGYAVASALAAEGVRVVVNGRREESVAAAVAALRAAYPGAEHSGLAADFGDPAQVDALLGSLSAVDILVNNVGLFDLAPFGDIADDEWARYLEVNLMSGVRLSRHLLPGMLERGCGRIVFVSSESGVNVPADMIHYGVTKAAMIAPGNGLAKLTRGTAVTVNTVLGGPTYSDGVTATVESIAAAQSAPVDAVKAAIIGQNRTTLLERFLEPTELASLVAYLASPLASATNGAAVRADGGVLTGLL
ncbi:SDR family NAD(P)-dependent oxidoreductase [Leifsonia shinshuensis]|uniref:NAD(P)-dependent dehydrogenase (Short-subunit alcohol dehydrogenase family) n=1 Tax=Leifsonia shinshuensis TaxID=150026 RepID=A0A853CZD3_9MICO|nr:SDR family oxidoreductase [Leifsonia shinshuensis]NYJ25948.1 NAD(P)-dependent dehydrogenase (short-subunit alcohol dehydrogenase family) [Leifsonia shinshuensis]